MVELEAKSRRGTTGKGHTEKFLLVAVSLVASVASAQVVSGSIVVINFAKDQTVVAADSRGKNNDTGILDDSYCKISAFGKQFVFTSTGGSRLVNGAFSNGIPSWDNADLARDAINGLPNNGDDDMTTLTKRWAISAGAGWTKLCAARREVCAGLAAHSGEILTEGIFYRVKDLSVAGAKVSFDSTAIFDSVKFGTFKSDLTKCWPCGQADGERICVAGEHFDIAEKFCSMRKYGDAINIRTHLSGEASPKTKLPIKIVEMTIDAYSKNGGSVGGPVDAITIKKGGITWNALKPNCPANKE